MSTKKLNVGVIGAGTMGQGIAQLALQAGHSVTLIDNSTEQLNHAKNSLNGLFTKFVEKNKITAAEKDSWLNSLSTHDNSSFLSNADIVIEAIVERLDVKQQVFTQLESIVRENTILATNTSSLSVTAIASCLKDPSRFIGLHFFNPPGIMPLVEVINALQTAPEITQTCVDLMVSWGKKPVRCRNTPGFIVNRVARPFYIESFRLLENQITTPEYLDISIRSAGFKMGPCELTDFIGQDVNYAVSCSLFDSLFYPAHLRPSYIQGSLVEANFLGRKSGRGFYNYDEESPSLNIKTSNLNEETIRFIKYGKHPWITEQSDSLDQLPIVDTYEQSEKLIGILENGIHIYISDGRTAADWENSLNIPIALSDIKHPNKNDATLALAFGPKAKDLLNDKLPQSLGQINWFSIDDYPGLINLRVISMIINEAAICATQGIATPKGIDSALKGGVNYPLGAFEWLDALGTTSVINTLKALRAEYGSDCYTVPRLLISYSSKGSVYE